MWGETVNAVFDNAGAQVLRSLAGVYHVPGEDKEFDCTICVRGDDFLAERQDAELDYVHSVWSDNCGVMDAGSIGPECPGEVRYFKRSIGYTEKLTETGLPGFYWKADPKNTQELTN